jgi:hypothetical protein
MLSEAKHPGSLYVATEQWEQLQGFFARQKTAGSE